MPRNINFSKSNKFSDEEIQFIKDIIQPKHFNVGYLYQIVANYKSGLDCDKID